MPVFWKLLVLSNGLTNKFFEVRSVSYVTLLSNLLLKINYKIQKKIDESFEESGIHEINCSDYNEKYYGQNGYDDMAHLKYGTSGKSGVDHQLSNSEHSVDKSSLKSDRHMRGRR